MHWHDQFIRLGLPILHIKWCPCFQSSIRILFSRPADQRGGVGYLPRIDLSYKNTLLHHTENKRVPFRWLDISPLKEYSRKVRRITRPRRDRFISCGYISVHWEWSLTLSGMSRILLPVVWGDVMDRLVLYEHPHSWLRKQQGALWWVNISPQQESFWRVRMFGCLRKDMVTSGRYMWVEFGVIQRMSCVLIPRCLRGCESPSDFQVFHSEKRLSSCIRASGDFAEHPTFQKIIIILGHTSFLTYPCVSGSFKKICIHSKNVFHNVSIQHR